MSDTLEWYARRGLLAASDEDKAVNKQRLEAGRHLCRLFCANNRSGGLTAQYQSSVSAQTPAPNALTRVEQEVENGGRLQFVLQSLPPRTRRCVEQVCFIDERVGKPMMERLRCGLDALTEIVKLSKKTY